MANPFRLDSRSVYQAPLLSDIPWLKHGFGTRLSTKWPGDVALATVRQIHSDIILATEGPGGLIGDGDALVTSRPLVFLAIRTADCLPIFIADRRLRVVAAAHAGWRGTVCGIAAKTVKFLSERYGTRVEDLAIATGPAIGECCFEVGPDVGQLFGTIFPERDDLLRRARIDLAEANRRQLRQIGIAEEQIVTPALCTSCGSAEFHSFRRDREASGRMLSMIGMS